MAALQQFGGDWTEKKLNVLRKYLSAYLQALKNYSFQTMYIDAFAGTGYRFPKNNKDKLYSDLFSKEEHEDVVRYLDGSPRIALQMQPGFKQYYFIEKSKKKCIELEKLKSEFPFHEHKITCINDDANLYLQQICKGGAKEWKDGGKRAVLFLDPYGMEVEWSTLDSVARTEAIDTWILFPLGIGVSRLLKKNGEISNVNADVLTKIFGELDWREEFYKVSPNRTLFETTTETKKTATFEGIRRYFVKRLENLFPYVLKEPLFLTNSKNNPLFMLCFAAANKRGGSIAKKIASDIIKKE